MNFFSPSLLSALGQIPWHLEACWGRQVRWKCTMMTFNLISREGGLYRVLNVKQNNAKPSLSIDRQDAHTHTHTCSNTHTWSWTYFNIFWPWQCTFTWLGKLLCLDKKYHVFVKYCLPNNHSRFLVCPKHEAPITILIEFLLFWSQALELASSRVGCAGNTQSAPHPQNNYSAVPCNRLACAERAANVSCAYDWVEGHQTSIRHERIQCTNSTFLKKKIIKLQCNNTNKHMKGPTLHTAQG